MDDLVVIQKADLENHNKEGGLWVVIHGKVFDLQEFKDQVRSVMWLARTHACIYVCLYLSICIYTYVCMYVDM